MIARATLPGRHLDCQGDREGRPYNTKLLVLHVNVYCTGDPRGRPGCLFQSAISSCLLAVSSNQRFPLACWQPLPISDFLLLPGSLFQSAISSCFAVKRCCQHTENSKDQHYPCDASQRSEYADKVDDCKRGHDDEHTYEDNHVTDDEAGDGCEDFDGRTSSY